MKRFLKFLATTLVLSVMFGCGGKENKEVDTAKLYESVVSVMGDDLVKMNENYISNYFGIESENLSDCIITQSEDPKSASTFIMIKCEDSEKRQQYIESINNFLSQKYDELTNYDLPEEAELVKGAEVKTEGNWVYLIVDKNADEVNKLVQDSFK